MFCSTCGAQGDGAHAGWDRNPQYSGHYFLIGNL